MKDNFKNTELDHAFRQAIEQMEVQPSESFWNKAEAEILKKENLSYRRKLLLWRSISASVIVFLLFTSLYIFNLKRKTPSEKTELIAAQVKPNETFVQPLSSNLIETTNQKNISVNHKLSKKQLSEPNKNQNNKSSIYKTKKSTHLVFEENNSLNYEARPTVATKENNKANLTDDKNDFLPIKNDSTIFSLENTLKTEVDRNTNPSNELIDSFSLFVDATRNISENNSPPEKINSLPLNSSSRISFSLFFATAVANHSLIDNNASDGLSLGDINNREAKNISSGAGIKLSYALNKNISLRSGFSYYGYSFRIKPFTVFCEQGNNGDLIYSCITSSGTLKFAADSSQKVGDAMNIKGNSVQAIKFISLPLEVQLNFPSNRFIFYAASGITVDFLLHAKSNITYEYSGKQENKKFNSIEGLKNIHYGFAIGLGAKYNVSKNFFLNLEPSYNGAITSINKNSPTKSYPYFFRLGFGIGYIF